MALSTAETQSVYMACGLHSEGGTRYRYTFVAYSQSDLTAQDQTWDYSTVKTTIDARLALLSAAAIVKVQAFIVTYDANITSSFKKTAGSDGVILDDAEECELARKAITRIVGVEVEPVDSDDVCGNGRQGRLVR